MGELTDRQLLERFAGSDREMAEPCFAALIKRHGPMVLHTCQAILHDRHDAEDAFQATFLVLARKARSLWIRDSLGPWLFEVACRVAACARSAALRRRIHEREAARMGASTMEDKTWDDRGAVLSRGAESTAGSIPRGGRALRPGGADPGKGGAASRVAGGHRAQPPGARSAAAARPIDPPRIGPLCRTSSTVAHRGRTLGGGAGRTRGNHDKCRRAAHCEPSRDRHNGFGWFVDGRSTESHVLEQAQADHCWYTGGRLIRGNGSAGILVAGSRAGPIARATGRSCRQKTMPKPNPRPIVPASAGADP